MKPTSINYGIIGTGHIGNYHVQQSLKIKGINLIGVFDINFKRASLIGENYAVKAYNNLEQLLKQCDAVSITTPAAAHFEAAKIALQYDCHVFIEKPLTTLLQDADNLIALAKTKHKLIQVGHIERFNPVIVAFVAMSPKCSPNFIEIHRMSPFNKRGTDVDVVLDLMIHDIDLVFYLKKQKLKKVSATGVSVLTHSIDLANVRLEFADNSVANITASRISDSPMRKIRLFEEKKYTSLDLQNQKIKQYIIHKKIKISSKNILFDNKNNIISTQNIRVPKKNALREELVAFVHSIQNNQNCLVGADAGKRALQTALLIQQKINEQKR